MLFSDEYKSNFQKSFKGNKKQTYVSAYSHRIPENYGQENNDYNSRVTPLDTWCPCDGACPKCITNNSRPDHFENTYLKISEPDDISEHEADRVAEQVVHTPIIGNADSTLATPESLGDDLSEYKSSVNRKPLGILNNIRISESYPILRNGKDEFPLDPTIKNFMELQFGIDFSDVRIHNDENARESSAKINALAYTIGNHIVFGEGQYHPTTPRGRKLLAHELTHIIQQNRTMKTNSNEPSSGKPERTDMKQTKRAAKLVHSSSQNGVVQREILTYNKKHSERESRFFEGLFERVYQDYPAETSNVMAALQSLISAGKVGYRSTGNITFFYNISATQADFLTAFSTAVSSSLASKLSSAMMNNHEWYLYSRNSVVRSEGIFSTDYDFVGHVFERQTKRTLTHFEKSEAQKVFGSGLNLDYIIVDEDPLISKGGYARTTPFEINFPTGSFSGGGFMPWLIHELAHSWQYQHGYSMKTTLYHAVVSTYEYGDLSKANQNGKKLKDFNTEQQASIAADYYRILMGDTTVAQLISAYIPYINEFRIH